MKRILKASGRHTLIIAIEIVAVLVAILLLAWGGFILRLERGPISFPALVPAISDTINSNLERYRIDFRDVSISGGGIQRPLQLELQDVEIFDSSDDTLLAGVSKIGMQLSKDALMDGQLAPATISFHQINLRAFIGEDGGFQVNVNNREGGTLSNIGQSNILDVIKEDMLGATPANDNSAFSYLREIQISNADILFQHPDLKRDIYVLDTDVALKKQDAQIAAVLSGGMRVGTDTPSVPVQVHTYYNPDADQNGLTVSFHDLNAPSVLQVLPDNISQRLSLNGNVSGRLEAGIDRDFKVTSTALSAQFRDVTINWDNKFETGLVIPSADIRTLIDVQDRTLAIQKIDLAGNQGTLLTLSGRLSADESFNNLNLVYDAYGDGLKVEGLKSYWPVSVQAGVREWIDEHIQSGVINTIISQGHLQADLENDQINLEAFKAKFDFSDLDIKYFPDMLPVTDLSGQGLITDDQISFLVRTGQTLGATIEGARVAIAPFNGDTTLKILADIQGPVQDILTVLKPKPVSVFSLTDVPLEKLTGVARGQFKMVMPLATEGSAKPEISVEASGQEIAWPNLYKGAGLTNGTAAFSYARDKLNVKGTGLFNGRNASYEYSFDKTQPKPLNRLKVTGAVDESLIPPAVTKQIRISGVMPLELVRDQAGDIMQTRINLDVGSGTLSIPYLKYEKPAGAPAGFGVIMRDDGHGNVNLNELVYRDAGTLNLAGKATLLNGSIKTARFDRFTYKNTDIQLNVEDTGEHIDVTANGSHLRIADFWQKSTHRREGDDRNALTGLQVDQTQPAKIFQKPIRISANIGALTIKEDFPLRQAKVYFIRNPAGGWQQLELDALAGGQQLYIRYTPDDTGRHKLRLEADDAGETLRALGITNAIDGGILVIDGRPPENISDASLAGRIRLSQFTVTRAPVLARLINSLSLQGLSALLAGEGISFRALDANFGWRSASIEQAGLMDGQVRLSDGRTSGASLGLTFDGDLNLDRSTMDMNGNIVPFSGLNKAVGEIPVLGDLLTGGGDGVFAATYTAQGPVADPRVVVNPLAVLAPGILRNILFESQPAE